MPRTENTECSLIFPVQQATPVAQPTQMERQYDLR